MPGLRLKLSPFTRKLLLVVFVTLMMAYFAFGVFIWWAMHQPPETFGRVMAKMSGPVVFFPRPQKWRRAMWCVSAVKQLRHTAAADPIHATRQYSSGKSSVVADRSASVIIHSVSLASVW